MLYVKVLWETEAEMELECRILLGSNIGEWKRGRHKTG
jgi:hypothetical protein